MKKMLVLLLSGVLLSGISAVFAQVCTTTNSDSQIEFKGE
jgi:hypothetical protein